MSLETFFSGKLVVFTANSASSSSFLLIKVHYCALRMKQDGERTVFADFSLLGHFHDLYTSDMSFRCRWVYDKTKIWVSPSLRARFPREGNEAHVLLPRSLRHQTHITHSYHTQNHPFTSYYRRFGSFSVFVESLASFSTRISLSLRLVLAEKTTRWPPRNRQEVRQVSPTSSAVCVRTPPSRHQEKPGNRLTSPPHPPSNPPRPLPPLERPGPPSIGSGKQQKCPQ